MHLLDEVKHLYVPHWILELYVMVKVYLIAVQYFLGELGASMFWPQWRDSLLKDCKAAVTKSRDQTRPKIAVVTGADGTIGIEVVRLLLSLGFEVHGLVGNAKRANTAFSGLSKRADQPLHVHYVDFSHLIRLWQWIREFTPTVTHIDLVVCAAGVMLIEEMKMFGYETHACVNVIGQAIIVRGLEEKLKKAPNHRVLFMSSVCLHAADWNHHHLDNEFSLLASYTGAYQAYALSKLVIAVYAQQLARNRGVQVVSCHPGVVAGALYQRTNFVLRNAIQHFGPLVARTPRFAALLSLHIAMREDAEMGEYYENERSVNFRTDVDEKARRQIYDYVELAMERLR